MNINDLKVEAHETAVSKGWWDNPPSVPELLMLIVSEASEALEWYREHDGDLRPMRNADGKPEGVPSELADILIRVLDMSDALNIDIESALRTKLDYNLTRTFKHGFKLL